jgi:segregation and condensation protein B
VSDEPVETASDIDAPAGDEGSVDSQSVGEAFESPDETDESDMSGVGGLVDSEVSTLGDDSAVDEATVDEATVDEATVAEATDGFHPGDAGGEQTALPIEDEPKIELSDDELRGAVEAILLIVDEPATEIVLAQVLDQPVDRIAAVLERCAREYAEMGRGFELRRVAGGWRLYTRAEYAAYVEKFVLDGQQVRLTQAALETLAVVAYKQPVTRSRISAIRGVNCDGVVRTLVSRGLIEECGSEPESGAFLYRTTILFLEKLGLDSVEQLPPLAPFLPDDVDEIADAQR